MTHWTKSLALGALAAVSTVALTLPAQAVDFSGKTIEWIVPFREGGGTDRLTRILQPKLAALLPGNPTVLVLNQPGGGSIKASNKFHRSAPADGTMLFTASTSTFIPITLQSKLAKYDPNEWRALVNFPRGATFFGWSGQTGAGSLGTDMRSDWEALRGNEKLRFGLETPISAELLDLVALDLLDIEPQVLFGLSSKKAEAAFVRGEMNINTDNTRGYRKDFQKDERSDGAVRAIWSWGFVDNDGNIQRDPDLDYIPTYEEFYTKVKGEAPSGPGYDLVLNLMNNKVAISKAVMLPKGTPDDIYEAYLEAFRKLVEDPAIKEALKKEVGSLPIYFGETATRNVAAGTQMKPETRDWAKVWLKEHHNASLD